MRPPLILLLSYIWIAWCCCCKGSHFYSFPCFAVNHKMDALAGEHTDTHMQYSFSVPLGSSLVPSLPLSSLSPAVRFMFFSFAVTFWLTVISLIGTKRTIHYCRSHCCCRDSRVRFFFVNVGASMGS
ncbi:hypothetical protein BKA57DRAFT_474023 [Linnemannia elongata]|nr:hypothetical protein BKA57DRAFT_474023 [Linnemannia elongata]